MQPVTSTKLSFAQPAFVCKPVPYDLHRQQSSARDPSQRRMTPVVSLGSSMPSDDCTFLFQWFSAPSRWKNARRCVRLAMLPAAAVCASACIQTPALSAAGAVFTTGAFWDCASGSRSKKERTRKEKEMRACAYTAIFDVLAYPSPNRPTCRCSSFLRQGGLL